MADLPEQKYPAKHRSVGAVRPADAQNDPPVQSVQFSGAASPSVLEKVPDGHGTGASVPCGQK